MAKMYKIVLCGNYSVGKTSLVTRLVRNIFNTGMPPTIGASFITWKPDPRQKDYYGIWDTAGQERFAELLPLYFREAHIILYCWDSRTPVDEVALNNMYAKVRQYTNGYFYVVLTKSDLYDGVDFNPLKEWIKSIENSGGVFITSAQTGIGVRELFMDIDKQLKTKLPPLKKDNLTLEQHTNNPRRKCCNR